ncbi:MAG: phosphatase PAP2 family protein [Stellaceae bacterium]
MFRSPFQPTAFCISANAGAKWLVVGAVAALDTIGLTYCGIRLDFGGLAHGCGAITLLAGIATFYTYRRPDARIADLAHTAALLLAFFAAAGVLSYLVAATDIPLADAKFAAADRALGFDWQAWFAWVHRHPSFWLVLRLVYASAIPQVIAITVYLALSGQPKRNSEFLWAIMLSLLVIIPISALAPAAGAWVQYGAMRFADVAQVHDFFAMRSGMLHALDLPRLEGLINFPSFHTTLAIFFVYAVRRRMALLAFAAALNGVMIVAVLTEGGHYLVDAISGAAVAGAAITAAGRIEAALARKPLRAEPRRAPDTPVRT